MARLVLAAFIISFVFPLNIIAAPPSALSKPLARRYSGKATWFTPDTGACGDTNSESDYIVAMNYKQYGHGEPCHKHVKIQNKSNGKTITAKVTDECPSCGYGSLDLSPSVFKSLGDLNTGVLPISWDWA